MAAHPGMKNLKMWVKGQSGNQGKIYDRVPEELRGIKSLTYKEVVKIISKYARMTRQELQEVMKDTKTPVLEVNIASIFHNSIQRGDFQKLSFLLDRAIGKAQDFIQDDQDEGERRELGKLSMNELLTLVRTNLPPAES